MKYVVGFIVALVAVAVFAVVVAYRGAYDVAATAPDAAPVGWWLATTMTHSVRSRAAAEGLRRPARQAASIDNGFRHYRETCVHCHGAPGEPPDEWAAGMRPAPPDLAQTVPEWTDEQLFWIVQHGIKMTGMPAFGSTHSEQDLWDIVSFLDTLPKLSPQRYSQLDQQNASKPEQHSGEPHSGA